jgi:hypothetical protein
MDRNTKKIYATPALVGRGSLTDRTLEFIQVSVTKEAADPDLYERSVGL